MLSKSIIGVVLGAAAFVGSAGSAMSAQITGFGTPGNDAALVGAVVVDFETTLLGYFTSRSFGDLTISGDEHGHRLFASENLPSASSSQNTTGRFINNPDQSTAFVFSFAAPVSAFAFNRGAGLVNWTLSAYAADGGLVETRTVPGTGNSNFGEYFGLSGPGIVRVVLSEPSGDTSIRIDNFSYVREAVAGVPEPAGWALMIMGFAATGFVARRARAMA